MPNVFSKSKESIPDKQQLQPNCFINFCSDDNYSVKEELNKFNVSFENIVNIWNLKKRSLANMDSKNLIFSELKTESDDEKSSDYQDTQNCLTDIDSQNLIKKPEQILDASNLVLDKSLQDLETEINNFFDRMDNSERTLRAKSNVNYRDARVYNKKKDYI